MLLNLVSGQHDQYTITGEKVFKVKLRKKTTSGPVKDEWSLTMVTQPLLLSTFYRGK